MLANLAIWAIVVNMASFARCLKSKTMAKCRQIVTFAKFTIFVEFTAFRIPPSFDRCLKSKPLWRNVVKSSLSPNSPIYSPFAKIDSKIFSNLPFSLSHAFLDIFHYRLDLKELIHAGACSCFCTISVSKRPQ